MTTQSDSFEPFDVLLEEVLQAPLPVPRRRGQWLAVAAVALLGLGAVVGAFVWRSRQELPSPRFVTQPQGKDVVVPKDRAEFERLLGTASAMRFARKVITGATRDNPASEHLDFETWPETFEVAGAELAGWQKAIAASAQADKWSGVDVTLEVEVRLPEGRRMLCFVTFAEQSTANQFAHFGIGDEQQLPLIPNGELLGRLRAANEAIEGKHRLANGIARTFAEVAGLPADSTHLDCPVDEPKALRQALDRFGQLWALRLRQAPGEGAARISAEVLAGLAGLPLVSLDLDVADLGDDDLARLGALPALNFLFVRHGGAACTGAGVAPLKSLTGVAFLGCSGLTGKGVAALAALPRLRELVLSQSQVDDFVGLTAALRGMPALTTLLVRSEHFPDAALPGLVHAKLRHLLLLDTPVTGAGLAALANLPSLGELQLAGTKVGDGDIASLALLTNLQTLVVQNGAFTKDGVAALHEALPKCTLNIHPERRLFDTAAALPRKLLDLRD